MTPRVQRAIDIFLDAINENTLQAKVCTACAVGNLVRAGMLKANPHLDSSRTYVMDDNGVSNADWAYLFMTRGKVQHKLLEEDGNFINEDHLRDAKAAIAYTEFTEDELAQIEYVFETTGKDVVCKEDAIVKLSAVVELMLTFDECKEEVKEVFTKKAEALLC